MRDNFIGLSESSFFTEGLGSFVEEVINALNYLLENYKKINPNISKEISRIIWHANAYISGSTSNKVPFEIVYSLDRALKDWTEEKTLITTALLEEPSFHFCGLNPSKNINRLIPVKLEKNLILVALPRIYRHKYLYCIPLYHELGHYIDNLYQITRSTFIFEKTKYTKQELNREYNHRLEFFADLFASVYTGKAINNFLLRFAGDALDSESHPSTEKRIKVVDYFINGKETAEIKRIQKALQQIGLPQLKIKFKEPDLPLFFDNIRPCKINNLQELHGIVPAAWTYLDKVFNNLPQPWQDIGEFEAETTINDLVEKSVRNWMILDKWEYATTT